MKVSHITNFSIEKFFQTSQVVVCEAICEIHFEGPIWVAEPTMSKEQGHPGVYTSFCQLLS